MVFIMLWNRGQQGGVLKLMRMLKFKYFQPLGFLFLKFPGKSKSGLHNKYIKWQKWHM